MEQMKEENCEVLCSSSGTRLAVKQERKAKRDSIETFYDIPPFRARLFQTRLNVRMHSRNSHAASATRLEPRIASEKLSFGQTTKVLAFRILFLFFPLNVIRQRQDSRGLPNGLWDSLQVFFVFSRKSGELRDRGRRKIDGCFGRILIPIPQKRNGLIN